MSNTKRTYAQTLSQSSFSTDDRSLEEKGLTGSSLEKAIERVDRFMRIPLPPFHFPQNVESHPLNVRHSDGQFVPFETQFLPTSLDRLLSKSFRKSGDRLIGYQVDRQGKIFQITIPFKDDQLLLDQKKRTFLGTYV